MTSFAGRDVILHDAPLANELELNRCVILIGNRSFFALLAVAGGCVPVGFVGFFARFVGVEIFHAGLAVTQTFAGRLTGWQIEFQAVSAGVLRVRRLSGIGIHNALVVRQKPCRLLELAMKLHLTRASLQL